MPFRTSLDIQNRALQHVGASQVLTSTEDSKNNLETTFAYDKVRRAELRRNVWRFAIRKAVLRPVDVDTMILTPALYDATKTYLPGAIVADAAGQLWLSMTPDNINNTPGASDVWEMYSGPMTASRYRSATTYMAGELVYESVASPWSYSVYMSLQNGNGDDPSVSTVYDAAASYDLDDIVSYSGSNWRSLIEVNVGNAPADGPAAFDIGTTYTSVAVPATFLPTVRAVPATTYATDSGGVLRPFSANAPRYTDQGLLVETASTNFLLQSNAFSTSPWSSFQMSLSHNAPGVDGGALTAWTCTASGTASQTTQTVAIPSGTTISFYVAQGSATFLMIETDDAGGGRATWFNLATGTLGIVNGVAFGSPVAQHTNATITARSNGFYRCSITTSAAAATSTLFGICDTDGAITTVSGHTIILQNGQAEVGARSTYIPTTSASVTRSADLVTPAGDVSPLVPSLYTTIVRATFNLNFVTGVYYFYNAVTGSDHRIYSAIGGSQSGHDPTTDGGVHWANTGTVNAWSRTPTLSAHSGKWRKIAATIAKLRFQYPIGSGPSSECSTRNVFRLPNGFLREAPQDPKAGSNSYLGSPGGLFYDDWEFEGDYIVSALTDPIVFRFVADIAKVSAMDDMFCEGLALRLATAICEPITQSAAKLQTIASAYKLFMGEARQVNAIETGSVEPPLDDYLAVRA